MSYSFNELIKIRQAYRSFSDKPIAKDLLYDIIAMAKNAPSACNSQPWRVYITYTQEENVKMRESLQDNGRNVFLDTAKAFIAVYKNEAIKLNLGAESKFSLLHFVEYDIGEFVAYLTLAAKNKGVDSCIIGWVNNEKLNETFSLNGKCDLVIALGYAKDDKVRTKKRKDLKEIIINYKEEEL